MVLAQAEFTYNNYVNRSTGKTPFEIVIGMNPRGVSDLWDIVGEEKRSVAREEFVDFMKSLHKEVKLRIEQGKCKKLGLTFGQKVEVFFLFLKHFVNWCQNLRHLDNEHKKTSERNFLVFGI